MSIIVYPIKVSHYSFKNYCYLIVHSKSQEALLIDPAWEADKIQEIIHITRAQLKAILLTHHHYDHINLAESFAKQYEIPIRMSKVEIDYYEFSCLNLSPIENSDNIVLGYLQIKPIFTPGHTKGATCFLIDDALFTGDTLFIEGCGMCFGKGSDPYAMYNSLSFLKKIIPANTHVYPGHSYGEEPGKNFSYLLKNNIYLQFNEIENFVAYRMRQNQTNLFLFK